MAGNKSRQVIRAEARRAKKMPAGNVARTSFRWVGRTKGQPYSRQKVTEIIPAKSGVPATFVCQSHTRSSSSRVNASAQNIEWFMPNLPDNLRAALLGAF